MAVFQGIDFKRLSLREALDLAIAIEEEARDRYKEFAEQLTAHHTSDVAAFFARMASIEEMHRSKLSKRRQTSFPGERPTEMTASIFDVEAPEYDAARAFMSVRQALETVLAAEEKAYAFFARALPQLEDAPVRSLFLELADEEVEHQKLVKAEIARLSVEPSGTAEDYSDEPVAQ